MIGPSKDNRSVDSRWSGILHRRFAKGGGSFGPFNYAIGVDGSPIEAIKSAQDYPLQSESSGNAHTRFLASLTFWHEAAHLSQYVSTSFGLRGLRRSLICLRYLIEGVHWPLPILSRYERGGFPEGCSEHEIKALGRFLNFLDTFDQLRIHCSALDPMSSGVGIRADAVPWSPWLFYGGFFEKSGDERRDLLKDLNIPILNQILITSSDGKEASQVVLNAAAIMEGFALATELNHVVNALGFDRAEEVFNFLPKGSEYVAALEYGLSSGAFTLRNMLVPYAICADVALMYDPFVLFDSPNLEQPSNGQPPDQYPGQTYIAACQAAAQLESPRSSEREELERYYRELCLRMGLPTPEWMATRAHEVAVRLLRTVDTPLTTWLGKAMIMHEKGLELRMRSPCSSAVGLMTSNGILDVVEACRPYVSMYDIRSRQPEHFDPSCVDILTLHNLMFASMRDTSITCPLKLGAPFECHSAGKGDNTLCVFKNHDGVKIGECLVDLFEKACHLVDNV
jgi:hypothetical protein